MIKTTLPLLSDEPMSAHTTLRIGGPADFYARPVSPEEAIDLARFCTSEGMPLFVLGGGANILVSDRGIRGLVMDTSALSAVERRADTLWAEAGVTMDGLVSLAADHSLSGLESFCAMPGSVGGSVWMNARCYSVSLSELIDEVEYVDFGERMSPRRMEVRPADWGYKRSPFQSRPCLITAASFRMRPDDRTAILRVMAEKRADRERKGHFRHPSAGSAFKNDPEFGSPTGAIVDSLGLKGYRVGGAAVADYHGNIIINMGGASADDVKAVLQHVGRVVLEARGFRLEREILLVGEWEPGAQQGGTHGRPSGTG